jgi:hypothetical protein
VRWERREERDPELSSARRGGSGPDGFAFTPLAIIMFICESSIPGKRPLPESRSRRRELGRTGRTPAKEPLGSQPVRKGKGKRKPATNGHQESLPNPISGLVLQRRSNKIIMARLFCRSCAHHPFHAMMSRERRNQEATEHTHWPVCHSENLKWLCEPCHHPPPAIIASPGS